MFPLWGLIGLIIWGLKLLIELQQQEHQRMLEAQRHRMVELVLATRALSNLVVDHFVTAAANHPHSEAPPAGMSPPGRVIPFPRPLQQLRRR
jgi:hypothetical protein